MLKGLFGLFVALGVCAVSFMSTDAQAASKRGIDQVCKVQPFNTGTFVYKNSAPLRNSRGVMIGLRWEPTLIAKKAVLSSSTTIYSQSGKKIGSCPWASAHGFAGGRYRCTMSTSSLVRAAKSSGGSPSVYFKLRGNACVKVNHAGQCAGSNKGGCNRIVN